MNPPELPRLVMPGLATWVNEFGFQVIPWHYRSDPAKRGTWADEVAAGIPGGRGSDHWRQEQEIDPFILRGKPVYYAFSYVRNVIQALPCDITEFRRWTWFLSADFGSGGGATCWLIWAENPRTNDLVIFDEIYVDTSYGEEERTPEHIKPLIYRKLRHWSGIHESSPIDFRGVVRYAIGDPAGLSYMQEYRKQPMPVYVHGGSPDAKVKINDEDAGEERLNAYFSASFVCCASKDNPEGRWYVARGLCPRCGKERIGAPRLTILKANCPHLIAQLPTIRRKLARKQSEAPPEGNIRVEDHAVDAARYGAMSRPVVKVPYSPASDSTPDHERVVAGQFWRTIENQLEHARVSTLYDTDDEGPRLANDGEPRYRRGEEVLGNVVGGPW